MKSFAVFNHHKQWKVSYGEHIYWRLGAGWFRASEDHKTLTLVEGEERAELEKVWFVNIQGKGW